MIQHDPRCDQQHTPRQQCNRRMTPAAARLARLAAEATVVGELAEPAPPPVELAPEPELEPDLVREAVATIDPIEPTVFVSREVDATAHAVERAYRQPSAPRSPAADRRDPASTAALVGLSLAILLWLIMRLAHRSGRD